MVAVGRGSEGFDVTPDEKELWAANAGDGTISIVDIARRKVTQTLDANVKGANRLKFTLDGKLAFVSSLGGADLAVFDVSSRKEVKRIKLGRGAAGILMQPDGARVYVACQPGQLRRGDRFEDDGSGGARRAGNGAGRAGVGGAAVERTAKSFNHR